jgi:RNA-directed DNA polymerase
MPPFNIDFRIPGSQEEISSYLGLSPDDLAAAIAAGINPDSEQDLYTRHRLPKKNRRPGQFRVVWDVNDTNLRDAHRSFARRFEIFARQYIQGFPHSCTYGYVRGRNIKENASRHVGKKVIFRCDLENYFPSIGIDRLATRLKEIGLKEEAAAAIAKFTTIEGALALGLNASPLLSNIVSLNLDTKLSEFARHHGYVYTRYADDITISGDTRPDQKTIFEIIESEGFRVSPHKTRVTKLGQAHYVTGLSVSDHKAPHVPRDFKRRLRQELYYANKFGIENHLAKIAQEVPIQRWINRIDGSIRFVGSVEPLIGRQLQATWSSILEVGSAHVSYEPLKDPRSTSVTFVIDETTFKRDDKEYLAIGCATVEQIQKIRTLTEATLRSHLVDPFSGGKKPPLERNGLHFSDAPESLRTSYSQLLAYLPFRSYIAFAELPSSADYETTYIRLLKSLLPRRFMAHDSRLVTVIFEQNPSVSPKAMCGVVAMVYAELELKNDRRPSAAPVCEVKGKLDEMAFSLPDALLWIFRSTFDAADIKELNYMRFERLRDKYRHIINLDTGDVFSRRHPIELPDPLTTKAI